MTGIIPDRSGPLDLAPPCGCCKGRGEVPDIDGNPRPCSRCRPVAEFSTWYAAKMAAENGGS